jgi:hypothetical protein
VPWLNNFRQNVQDKGLFDAPDATVALRVDCATPLELRATVRNLGLALLPAGVEVGFYPGGGAPASSLAPWAKSTLPSRPEPRPVCQSQTTLSPLAM